MATIYLSLVHTGSRGNLFMKSPVDHLRLLQYIISLKDRDIQAEISDDEAHTIYANIAANFIILQNQV